MMVLQAAGNLLEDCLAISKDHLLSARSMLTKSSFITKFVPVILGLVENLTSNDLKVSLH
jgi:hypothetical protein